ncbi:MAG: sulfurtransferase-like selenium metabolism protein YedF [Desulfomonilia bacterium]|jgi:selenium metabolism protein YedF
MRKEVDARGKACPEPVVLTKKALDEANTIVVIVDNPAAEENVRRFALSRQCRVETEHRGGDTLLFIERQDASPVHEHPAARPSPASGPLVVVIGSDRMGSGDDELGSVLMRSFIHTLAEAQEKPEIMIFFNTGVKLAIEGSEVIEDLRGLCDSGVKMLVCGTCLGYFEAKDRLAAGQVSNMYEIAETMLSAGRLVRI